MWSSVRGTAPRSRLLSRAPGSESQPATSVPPGLAAAGAVWAAGFASAGLAAAAGAVVAAGAAGAVVAAGAAGLAASAGFDSAGLLGAGAAGAQAWISPAAETRPSVWRKLRRDLRDRWGWSLMMRSPRPDTSC